MKQQKTVKYDTFSYDEYFSLLLDIDCRADLWNDRSLEATQDGAAEEA